MNIRIVTKDRNFFERLAAAFAGRDYNDVSLRISDRCPETRQEDEIIIIDKSESGAGGRCIKKGSSIAADAIFLDSSESICGENIPVIMKYSGISKLHSDLRDLQNSKRRSILESDEGKCKIALFCGAEGGAGASTMASAAALTLSPDSFYLNLEKISGETYFTDKDGYNLSDVIFAAKSRENSQAEKLKRMFARDECGVGFIRPPSNEADREWIDSEVCDKLCDAVKQIPGMRFAAVDAPYCPTPAFFTLVSKADVIFLVCDRRRESSNKADKIKNILSAFGKNVIEIVNRCNENINSTLTVPEFIDTDFCSTVDKVSARLKSAVQELTEEKRASS